MLSSKINQLLLVDNHCFNIRQLKLTQDNPDRSSRYCTESVIIVKSDS